MMEHKRNVRAAASAAMLIFMTAGGALAQSAPDVVLTGRAVTGADSRTVLVRFICTGNAGAAQTGALGVELEVPNSATLSASFDFDPFEGPDANAGALSRLTSIVEGATAQGSFTASGSIPGKPDTSFVLAVTAALRRDAARLAALARILRPLASGAGTLQWRQDNATAGGAAILATVEVSAAQSNRLKTLLGLCLAQAPK